MKRNPDGTFAKGNKGGPGRPRRADEERYLKALGATVSMSDWREICETAVVQAKRGDRYARQFLAEYLIGKPTQYVQADVEADQAILIDLDF